jgi:hypothetical protein
MERNREAVKNHSYVLHLRYSVLLMTLVAGKNCFKPQRNFKASSATKSKAVLARGRHFCCSRLLSEVNPEKYASERPAQAAFLVEARA